MTAYNPRTAEEIYESLKARLQNRIPELTNFIETSFNYVFTRSYSEQQHKAETAAAAVQLSGWVDYVGKPLTQAELDDLEITGTNPIEINQFVDSEHLDEYAKAFGVTRDEGAEAVGTLNVTTLQTVTIPEGTEFATQPDADGDFISFFTTQTETITGAQQDYPVEIQAAEVGVEANLPTNTVTYMPNPPVGVDSVTNLEPISGGIDEQSNSSLREDVKNAVVESAEGGTVNGLEGYIENNTDARSALVQEKYQGDVEHGDYAHADVIVFGGEEQNVLDAIDFAHPSGSEHFLIRPEIIEFDVDIVLSNGDADATAAEEAVEEYLLSLDLGDEVYESKIVQTALNADPSIENVESIIIEVIEEKRETPGYMVANFDDGTRDTQSEAWIGFTIASGTEDVSVQSTNPIDGTHSLRLNNDGTANTLVYSQLDPEFEPLQPEFVEFAVSPVDFQSDTTGSAKISTNDGGTNTIVGADILASGSVDLFSPIDSVSNFLSISEGDVIRIGFEYDWDSAEVTAYGENVTTATENTTTINIDVTTDSNQVNFIKLDNTTGPLTVDFDSFHVYDTLIKQTRNDIDSSFDTDAVTGVTGELYTVEGNTFVEGTDFVEYNSVTGSTDAPYDSIKFLTTGDIPDPESTFLIDYFTEDDLAVEDEEVAQLRNSSVTTQ